jgi:hypothetical protein
MGVSAVKLQIVYDLSDAVLTSLWLAGEIPTTSTRSTSRARWSNNRSAAADAPEGLKMLRTVPTRILHCLVEAYAEFGLFESPVIISLNKSVEF